MKTIREFDIIVQKLGNRFIGYKIPIYTTLNTIKRYNSLLLQQNVQFNKLLNIDVINIVKPEYPVVIAGSVTEAVDFLTEKHEFDIQEYSKFVTTGRMLFTNKTILNQKVIDKPTIATDLLSKLVRNDGALVITKYVNLSGIVGMVAEASQIGVMLSLRHSVTEEIFTVFKQQDKTGYLVRGNTVEEVIQNLVNI